MPNSYQVSSRMKNKKVSVENLDLISLEEDGSISCIGLETYVDKILKRIIYLDNEVQQLRIQNDNFHKFYQDYLSRHFGGLPSWERILSRDYQIDSIKIAKIKK